MVTIGQNTMEVLYLYICNEYVSFTRKTATNNHHHHHHRRRRRRRRHHHHHHHYYFIIRDGKDLLFCCLWFQRSLTLMNNPSFSICNSNNNLSQYSFFSQLILSRDRITDAVWVTFHGMATDERWNYRNVHNANAYPEILDKEEVGPHQHPHPTTSPQLPPPSSLPLPPHHYENNDIWFVFPFDDDNKMKHNYSHNHQKSNGQTEYTQPNIFIEYNWVNGLNLRHTRGKIYLIISYDHCFQTHLVCLMG